MSDTVKIVIEIPKEAKQAFDKAERNDLKGGYYDHGGIIGKAIQNGIPLDDVKVEIKAMFPPSGDWMYGEEYEHEHTVCEVLSDVLQILDNIGKAESEE